jgi:hypothetical protein
MGWQAQTSRLSRYLGEHVMRFSQWFRLLSLWQPLRRAASACLAAVNKAMLRSLELLRSSSGGRPGVARVWTHNIVLVLASIVLMAVHMRSD